VAATGLAGTAAEIDVDAGCAAGKNQTMSWTREICGVDVSILTEGTCVWARVGGESMTAAEIARLRVSADCNRTVEIGPYTFDSIGLAELKAYVRAGSEGTNSSHLHQNSGEAA
jgi:hypothetical protein